MRETASANNQKNVHGNSAALHNSFRRETCTANPLTKFIEHNIALNNCMLWKIFDMIFIFRFAFTCVFARITTSYTTLEKTNRLALLIERDTDNLFALAPENIFPQDSDLLSQDSDPLFQDSDSFFEDSSDSLIQNSDPLLPPNGVDNALQSVDQTSATTCDEIQSNLNLFSDSPPSLNARDLADELPGFKDFLAPLNQIKDSTCVAPKNPQQPGGSNPGGQNRQNSDLPAPLPDQKRYQYQVAVYGTCYFMGVVSPLHPLALCCDGLREGANVHDCDNCKFRNTWDLQMIVLEINTHEPLTRYGKTRSNRTQMSSVSKSILLPKLYKSGKFVSPLLWRYRHFWPCRSFSCKIWAHFHVIDKLLRRLLKN